MTQSSNGIAISHYAEHSGTYLRVKSLRKEWGINQQKNNPPHTSGHVQEAQNIIRCVSKARSFEQPQTCAPAPPKVCSKKSYMLWGVFLSHKPCKLGVTYIFWMSSYFGKRQQTLILTLFAFWCPTLKNRMLCSIPKIDILASIHQYCLHKGLQIFPQGLVIFRGPFLLLPGYSTCLWPPMRSSRNFKGPSTVLPVLQPSPFLGLRSPIESLFRAQRNNFASSPTRNLALIPNVRVIDP